MQISVSVRHGQISDATRSKIEAKLQKLTRYFERLTAIELAVDLEHRDVPRVDLRVSAEHKHDFVATERSGELMASVDSVVHKMEQQLRKYKEKVQDHHRFPGLREASLPVEPEREAD